MRWCGNLTDCRQAGNDVIPDLIGKPDKRPVRQENADSCRTGLVIGQTDERAEIGD